MIDESFNELKELREAVASASEHTKKQLDSIDGTLLFKSLAAVVVSLGLSYFFKIAILWIPICLLILPIWSIYGLKNISKNLNKKKYDELVKSSQKYPDHVIDYGYVWILRNASPMLKAFSMIYICALIIFIGVMVGFIPSDQEFPKLIPLINIGLCCLPIFFFDNLINFLEKQELNKYLKGDLSKHKLELSKVPIGKLSILFLLIMILILITLSIMYVLPIFSLVLIQNIYLPFNTESWFLILVGLLQFITFAMFCNYFSSLSVKKEFTNTLTNLASIDYQITRLLLNKNADQKAVLELKNALLTAKRYELAIDNFFVIFPYYVLIMSRVQVKQKMNSSII